METTESLVEKLKLTTNGKLKNAAAALFLRDTSQFPQFLLRMANVVRFIDAKIRKRLIISFLRIILSDPLGVRTQDPILKRDVLYRLS